ncbi:MAG: ABC transporter ATP-binding protein [Anaerolineae bacterium]
MTKITVENVFKQFQLSDGHMIQAVDGVSLKISEGGTVAIIGPSGCGKTTLLRMIAGLETPDSGRVLYDDEPIALISHEERGIGMIFQDFALMPQWDAQSNIGFFLRLRKREREVPERVHQISKITGFGIEQLMGKLPRQLSGGEKQRVSIARAFARDLKLLLFDEPFVHLDAQLREQARLEARRLLNKYPVTLVYVTHDQREAALMSDHLILMQNGRIEQVGSYRSLYDAPYNIFVAEFIGVPTINLFEGVIRDGRWYGQDFGGLVFPHQDHEGHAVTLGIRPEQISLDGDIEARVMSVMPYHAERFQLLEVSTGTETWQVQVSYDQVVNSGDTLSVTLPGARRHYFDSRIGTRLN